MHFLGSKNLVVLLDSFLSFIAMAGVLIN
jgi:hypothetical protein